MKILFIYPKFNKFFSQHPLLTSKFRDYIIGSYSAPPSLGIPILVSLTPDKHEVTFVNDNMDEPIDYENDWDLVAISYFTPQAVRAFEIGDEFRRRGTRVAVGGIFPTALPEEAAKHADSVHIGEAEHTWLQLLDDAEKGQLKEVYEGGLIPDLSAVPIPDRDIYYGRAEYKWHSDMVQLSRGCFYSCPTCVVPGNFGKQIRFRPLEQVQQELETLKYKMFYLADDSAFFVDPRCVEYAAKFFKLLKPYGKEVFVSTPPVINTDPAFMDTLMEGGLSVVYMTFQLDPISNKAITERGTDANRQMIETVKFVQKAGARLYGAFWFGHDNHDEKIVDQTMAFIEDAGIDTAEFNVFTPYPNTRMYRSMMRQGRLIDRDWSKYNGAHVAYQPAQMPPERLGELYIEAWERFCELIDVEESSAWIV